MRPGAYAQVFLPLPVNKVMAAFKAGAGEIADFILGEALAGKLFYTEKILLSGFVPVWQNKASRGKGSARLHLQDIGRDMLHPQARGKSDGAAQLFPAPAGQAQHYVQGNISESSPLSRFHSFLYVLRAVGAAQEL